MWIELFSGRYTRYNKDASSVSASLTSSNKQSPGVVSTAPVKKIVWLQGDTIFVTAFQDGCLAFWDKDRDDPSSFCATSGLAPQAGVSKTPVQPLARTESYASETSQNDRVSHSNGDTSASRSRPHLSPLPEYTDDIVVTVPQLGNDKKHSGKFNPLAHWKVSRKPILGRYTFVLAVQR